MHTQHAFAQQIPYGKPSPIVSSIFELWSEFDLAIEKAIRGKCYPKEELDLATKNYNKVILRKQKHKNSAKKNVANPNSKPACFDFLKISLCFCHSFKLISVFSKSFKKSLLLCIRKYQKEKIPKLISFILIASTSLFNNKLIAEFETSQIGNFNLENWCAAVAMGNELKLPIKKMQTGMKSFKGVKRRLEIRSTKKITVIDDFAHSPSKASQSVDALTKHFPDSRIFVVFEPNRGGRALKCMHNYNNVFKGIYKHVLFYRTHP
jgi:UDP-N-acetylmuramoylalanine-D-glutamate ligase